MDLSRIGLGKQIAAGAALVLIISLFMPWYGASAGGFSVDASGWEAMSFADILLFVGSLVVIGLVVGEATGNLPAGLPLPPLQIMQSIAGTALLIVLFRIIDIPEPDGAGDVDGVDFSRKLGVFIALLSAAAMTFGSYRAQQDAQRFY